MAVDEDSYAPSIAYSLIAYRLRDLKAEMTIMCSYMRFEVTIDADDLKQDPSGGALYVQFVDMCKDQEDDPDALEEWAVEPCMPEICRLAPVRAIHPTYTLEDWFRSPTFFIRLKSVLGALTPELVSTDITASEYLESYRDLTDLEAARPAIASLPRCAASHFQTDSPFPAGYADPWDIPGPVLEVENGRRLSFHLAVDGDALLRHLEVYSLLSQHSQSVVHHVPKFHSITTLDDKVVGFLTEAIGSGTDETIFDCSARYDTQAARLRWYNQMAETVEYLHQLGVSGINLDPYFIKIDDDDDAYITDFSERWVERQNTEEPCDVTAGDLEALQDLKNYLKIE